MHRKLFHIILLICAVWLMSSCSSGTGGDDSPTAGSEMAFTVADLSRASVDKDLNSAGSRFAVWGDMRYNTNPLSTIFDNTPVSYSDGKWVYDDTQYWFPHFEYSFVAIHPATESVSGISGLTYSGSELSFSYTLPEDYKEASDIKAATHRRKHKEDAASPAAPISLGFFHTMSRIDFKVKNNEAADKVIVHEIKLEGINRTGSFTISPAPLSGGAQTSDNSFAWTGISNPGALTSKINVEIPENGTSSLFPDDNALIMIPQPDNHSVIMSISYTMIDEGADDEHIRLTAETPIGGWEQGKSYTYSLEVNELTTEIYLTVRVKDWQKPGPTGVTVPES